MPEMLNGALFWLPIDQVDKNCIEQIYHLSSMPFIYKHVAVMPDCHLGRGAAVGSCIPTKGAIIPAAVGVDIGCFVGETKIPLLDGTQRALRELAEGGEEFWVYSIDQETQQVVPGKARALKTRDNAPLMRVVVSGGDEIVSTPDHEFMLSDGTWCEAQHLKSNDSLMPLYRKWATRDGYESVSNGARRSQRTHVMAYESLNGPVPEGHVIHHRNGNRFDNRPENLTLMTPDEHSAHHRPRRPGFGNAAPEFQRRRHAGIARSSARPERQERMAKVGRENITAYIRERPDHFREVVADNRRRGSEHLSQFNTSPRCCDDCDHEAENPAAVRWHKHREHAYNHRVLSVEHVARRDEVFCLQVDEHHNFALAAGVFVHNCGMIAVETNLRAGDMKHVSLETLRTGIERRVPLSAGKYNKRVFPSAEPKVKELEDMAGARLGFYDGFRGDWRRQIGTLGSGNHFIEIVLDEREHIWAFLHSGSRGIGNKVAQHHIKIAKKLCQRWHIGLADQDLAYLPVDTDEFKDYFRDLQWCQRFAELNREEMMTRVLTELEMTLGERIVEQDRIACHHNFTQWEHWDGENILVSRKGAIEAKEGQMGLIPGSMGTASYVVRGLGNRASFNTAPHGAGRRFSRSAAKRQFNMEDFDRELRGIEVRRTEAFLDEIPSAYKDINDVMEQSADLVEVVHVFRQIINVKGD